jgi:hypothetical protein
MASMTFLINDSSTGGNVPIVQVTITENADGTVTFDLVQVAVAGAYLGDLRGLFFDVADELLVSSGNFTVVPTTNFTELLEGNDSVKDLGQGANMQGLLGSDGGYDVGIEIGTSGIGTNGDDVRSFSFTLDNSLRDLTLADFANVSFGVRLTSVGQTLDANDSIDTSQTGSAKVGETTIQTISFSNDSTSVYEPNTDGLTPQPSNSGNIFDNEYDVDSDGYNATLDVLTVTGWSGGAVGSTATLTDPSGATAAVTLNTDGSWTVDASGANALDDGETIIQTLTANVLQTRYADAAHNCGWHLRNYTDLRPSSGTRSSIFPIPAVTTTLYLMSAPPQSISAITTTPSAIL